MNYANLIPASTLAALERYKALHCPTGDFLRSAISNELRQTIVRGDLMNIAAILPIVMYISNELPASSQGSPEAYSAWINQKE